MTSYRPLLLAMESGKKAVSAILSIIFLVVLLSCTQKESSSKQGEALFIRTTGPVKIVAYRYPPSPRTEQVCAERRKFLDEKIRGISDSIPTQPAYLQSSNRKLLELVKLERRLIETSTNWPIVCVNHVLLEKEKPSRYMALLRTADRPLDVALLISSDETLDEPEAFDLVRSAITHLDSFTSEDWNRWKPSSGEAFGPDGELKPDELQQFVGPSVFVGPPN